MEELSKFGVLAARYQYNGLGQRVMKTLYKEVQGTAEENQIYVFHYDQSGRLLQTGIYRPNGPRHMRDRHFIWLDDMPVGYLETVYRVNGNVLSQDMHYLSADHLNTPRFATNENGVMSWEWTADAFGIGELDLDPDGDGVNVNMRLRFPGQYDDEESITYYNYFRDYDPTIGRYMQSDPIGLSGGLNTYWYVGGNPIGFVDPTGEWFFIPAAVVAGIGVVYGAAKVSYTTIAITYNYDFLDRGPKAQNNLDTFVETGDIDLLNDLNRYQNDNFNNVADGAQNSLDLFLSIRDVQRSIAKLCR